MTVFTLMSCFSNEHTTDMARADMTTRAKDLACIQPIYEKLDASLDWLEANPNKKLSQEQRTRISGQLKEMGVFISKHGSEDAYLAVRKLEKAIKDGTYDKDLVAEADARQDYTVLHVRKLCQDFIDSHVGLAEAANGIALPEASPKNRADSNKPSSRGGFVGVIDRLFGDSDILRLPENSKLSVLLREIYGVS